MKAVFWAVKWPSRDGGSDSHTIRVSGEKFEDPVLACRDCYGMATKEMVVINLGANKRSVMRAVRDGLEKRTDWKPIP